ncbi:MAG: copper transporter [Paraclostridium sp.]
MHINMKYYVVTIGAIFIALGIGMLVGFNLNYDQELSDQQAVIIEDLDKKFEELKTKNDDLEESVQISEKNNVKLLEYINTNYSKLIKGELSQKNVGIFTTSDDYDYKEVLNNIMNESGATIAFDIVISGDISNKDKIKELSNILEMDLKTSQDVINYMMDVLKNVNAEEKLKELDNLNMISINSVSQNYSEYTDVVVAGGSSKENKEKIEALDKVLIEKLKQENKHVIGTQKSDAKNSYIEEYKESKISTVDNIEEGLGKLSLVELLKEKNIKGNFGRLETADGIIPFK